MSKRRSALAEELQKILESDHRRLENALRKLASLFEGISCKHQRMRHAWQREELPHRKLSGLWTRLGSSP